MKSEIYKLIEQNTNMIYKIASKYIKYSSIEDLFQAGCTGIIKAYNNYKNDMNTKFSTYAFSYILGEITAYANNDKLIKLNTENKKICKLYEKTREYLTKLNNKEPSIYEVSLYLGISELDIYNALSNNYCTESIDECVVEDLSLHEVIGNDDREYIDNRIDLDAEISNLNENEKNIINYRYYLDYTQSETAKALGINQVQVSRLETKALTRIKQRITS